MKINTIHMFNKTVKIHNLDMQLHEAIDIFSHYWPSLFLNGQLRPMSIGIKEELFDDKIIRDFDISCQRLNDCLTVILYSQEYRITLVTGTARYNKDGLQQGRVTDPNE